jgi:hypothetical protein
MIKSMSSGAGESTPQRDGEGGGRLRITSKRTITIGTQPTPRLSLSRVTVGQGRYTEPR